MLAPEALRAVIGISGPLYGCAAVFAEEILDTALKLLLLHALSDGHAHRLLKDIAAPGQTRELEGNRSDGKRIGRDGNRA